QSPERLARVRAAIDEVYASDDAQWLYAHADDFHNPAESRLLAAAKIRAQHELRAGSHESRQGIDIDMLAAITAALDSLTWTDPAYYRALCDAGSRAPGVWQTGERRAEHEVRRLQAARRAAKRVPVTV